MSTEIHIKEEPSFIPYESDTEVMLGKDTIKVEPPDEECTNQIKIEVVETEVKVEFEPPETDQSSKYLMMDIDDIKAKIASFKPDTCKEGSNSCDDEEDEFEDEIVPGSTDSYAHKQINDEINPYNMCKECGQSFRFSYQLRHHMLTHTGEKPFVCDVCNKAFTRKSVLVCHKRTHTNIKPYSCEICCKSFRQSFSLRQHMLTHTGEKPHSCEVCGKSFANKSNYNGHMKVHSIIKPHTCQICGKGFTQRRNLIAHWSIHKDAVPYACDKCDHGFAEMDGLRDHKHTTEKPLSCDISQRKVLMKRSFERT